MLTLIVVFLCLELPNSMKLVLDKFNDTLLTANHVDNLSSSLLTSLLNCPEQKILVSSAKLENHKGC